MFEVRFVFKMYSILNRNESNNTRTLYVIIKYYILLTALSAERNDQQHWDIESNNNPYKVKCVTCWVLLYHACTYYMCYNFETQKMATRITCYMV